MTSELTSDMIKTSWQLCRTCRFVGKTGDHIAECDYIGKTKKRRACPVGWCNKYIKDPLKSKRRRRRSKKEVKK